MYQHFIDIQDIYNFWYWGSHFNMHILQFFSISPEKGSMILQE